MIMGASENPYTASHRMHFMQITKITCTIYGGYNYLKAFEPLKNTNAIVNISCTASEIQDQLGHKGPNWTFSNLEQYYDKPKETTCSNSSFVPSIFNRDRYLIIYENII